MLILNKLSKIKFVEIRVIRGKKKLCDLAPLQAKQPSVLCVNLRALCG